MGAAREAGPGPPGEPHVVHFYGEGGPARTVAAWIAPSVGEGGGALLLCNPTSGAAVRSELAKRGVDVAALEASGRLRILPAEETLDGVAPTGDPDPQIFHRLVAEQVEAIRLAATAPAIRAWGEMVDVLVRRGRPDSAASLERLWNEAIELHGFELLCSYGVGALDDVAYAALWTDACATHGKVVCPAAPERFLGPGAPPLPLPASRG